MARMLNGTDMHYDVLSGISVGSINAGGFALFPKGEEKEATEYLRTMWEKLTNDGVWKYWPGFEPYQALFNHTSLLDSSPLFETINEKFDTHNRTIHRNLITAAVNVETGGIEVQDFDDLTGDLYSTAVLASASVPFVFPYTKLNGKYQMDALSCGWNVNMISAINKCLEIVDDPSKIILDVMTMYPDSVDEIKSPQNQTTFTNYMRSRAIRS